jgi:hypothetical protein
VPVELDGTDNCEIIPYRNYRFLIRDYLNTLKYHFIDDFFTNALLNSTGTQEPFLREGVAEK